MHRPSDCSYYLSYLYLEESDLCLWSKRGPHFLGSTVNTPTGTRGYRVIRGGRSMRIPLLETVDSLNLTNMIIDVAVSNAYARGGIPLSVSGVANIKIASQSPHLDHAIQRFTGKSRKEIIRIAKETLEGNLRGVLSQLTPEEVNEDKTSFAEILLEEADHDLARLGLVLDTLKVQNVTDEEVLIPSVVFALQKSSRLRPSLKPKPTLERRLRTLSTYNEHVWLKSKTDKRNLRLSLSVRFVMRKPKRLPWLLRRKVAFKHKWLVQRQISKSQKARVEQIRQELEANLIEPSKAEMQAAIATAKRGLRQNY